MKTQQQRQTSQVVTTRCEELRKYWAPRNKKFTEWFKLISMVDELAQKNMESFVGNDPQASFKLLRHMLDQKIPHRVPNEQLTVETASAASELSIMFEQMWRDVNKRYRRRGKQGWTWDLIGFVLSTGWYSVFAIMSEDGSMGVAEVWNPATVFPQWDDELVECAHIMELTPLAASRMAARNNWDIGSVSGSIGTIKLYDYWRMDTEYRVYNSIVLNNQLVKPETYEDKFNRIPIFIAPVGGLPDSSVIMRGEAWKAECGMASVSTNENIYKYTNKWWTFSMQLLRDTVQARIKEKNRSGQPIVKPEDVFRRGAIFRMSPDEDVSFLVPPPPPVEIRSTQLDMEAMLQRGGPSWQMFGSVPGQMTAYVMSMIAASTNQIAKPYHRGIIDCITDIDNFWLDLIRTHNYKPHGLSLPKLLPVTLEMTADYEIRIPGDLVQRATVARMLDPEFKLSYSRVLEELFPEIKSPMQEKAMVKADEAERHPIHSMIALIRALKGEALAAREAGDRETAELYERAAEKVEASINLGDEEPISPAGPGRQQIGTRSEGVPPEGTSGPPTPQV